MKVESWFSFLIKLGNTEREELIWLRPDNTVFNFEYAEMFIKHLCI